MTPLEKRHYVHHIFTQIAPRYDLMNRLMTAAQDKRWRKLLLQQIELPPHGKLLDVATGTGDIALASLAQYPQLGQVIGLDFTFPMMLIGQQRHLQLSKTISPQKTDFLERLNWSGGDTLHLPFSDNSFEAVVSGFLMRNVTSVSEALAEQVRVCQVGGRVAVLEITRPADTLFGAIFRLYFHYIVPLLGGLITGEFEAYRYLPHSADAFLRPEELKLKMEQAGLQHVSYTMLMFGTVALHVGVKSDGQP